MQPGFVIGVGAAAAIVPLIAATWRAPTARSGIFWSLAAVALAGPAVAALTRLQSGWVADFATTLWVTIAATMAVFIVTAAAFRDVWRLAPLVSAYMLVLALIGLAWENAPPAPIGKSGAENWLALHIGLAVVTYALVTLAAVAALAAFVQERALKLKRKPLLDGVLPAVTDCDRMESRFLIMGETVLGAGLVTGAIVSVAGGAGPLPFDHKTVFTLMAFAVIGILLYARARHGMRGRRAARVALLAYLLLTLGYPGVKFVTDVLIRSA